MILHIRSPKSIQEMLIPKPQPRDPDFLGLEWGSGISIYFKVFPDDYNMQNSDLAGEQLYEQVRCGVSNIRREMCAPGCGAGVLSSCREDLERSYWSCYLYLRVSERVTFNL